MRCNGVYGEGRRKGVIPFSLIAVTMLVLSLFATIYIFSMNREWNKPANANVSNIDSAASFLNQYISSLAEMDAINAIQTDQKSPWWAVALTAHNYFLNDLNNMEGTYFESEYVVTFTNVSYTVGTIPFYYKSVNILGNSTLTSSPVYAETSGSVSYILKNVMTGETIEETTGVSMVIPKTLPWLMYQEGKIRYDFANYGLMDRIIESLLEQYYYNLNGPVMPDKQIIVDTLNFAIYINDIIVYRSDPNPVLNTILSGYGVSSLKHVNIYKLWKIWMVQSKFIVNFNTRYNLPSNYVPTYYLDLSNFNKPIYFMNIPPYSVEDTMKSFRVSNGVSINIQKNIVMEAHNFSDLYYSSNSPNYRYGAEVYDIYIENASVSYFSSSTNSNSPSSFQFTIPLNLSLRLFNYVNSKIPLLDYRNTIPKNSSAGFGLEDVYPNGHEPVIFQDYFADLLFQTGNVTLYVFNNTGISANNLPSNCLISIMLDGAQLGDYTPAMFGNYGSITFYNIPAGEHSFNIIIKYTYNVVEYGNVEISIGNRGINVVNGNSVLSGTDVQGNNYMLKNNIALTVNENNNIEMPVIANSTSIDIEPFIIFQQLILVNVPRSKWLSTLMGTYAAISGYYVPSYIYNVNYGNLNELQQLVLWLNGFIRYLHYYDIPGGGNEMATLSIYYGIMSSLYIWSNLIDGLVKIEQSPTWKDTNNLQIEFFQNVSMMPSSDNGGSGVGNSGIVTIIKYTLKFINGPTGTTATDVPEVSFEESYDVNAKEMSLTLPDGDSFNFNAESISTQETLTDIVPGEEDGTYTLVTHQTTVTETSVTISVTDTEGNSYVINYDSVSYEYEEASQEYYVVGNIDPLELAFVAVGIISAGISIMELDSEIYTDFTHPSFIAISMTIENIANVVGASIQLFKFLIPRISTLTNLFESSADLIDSISFIIAGIGAVVAGVIIIAQLIQSIMNKYNIPWYDALGMLATGTAGLKYTLVFYLAITVTILGAVMIAATAVALLAGAAVSAAVPIIGWIVAGILVAIFLILNWNAVVNFLENLPSEIVNWIAGGDKAISISDSSIQTMESSITYTLNQTLKLSASLNSQNLSFSIYNGYNGMAMGFYDYEIYMFSTDKGISSEMKNVSTYEFDEGSAYLNTTYVKYSLQWSIINVWHSIDDLLNLVTTSTPIWGWKTIYLPPFFIYTIVGYSTGESPNYLFGKDNMEPFTNTHVGNGLYISSDFRHNFTGNIFVTTNSSTTYNYINGVVTDPYDSEFFWPSSYSSYSPPFSNINDPFFNGYVPYLMAATGDIARLLTTVNMTNSKDLYVHYIVSGGSSDKITTVGLNGWLTAVNYTGQNLSLWNINNAIASAKINYLTGFYNALNFTENYWGMAEFNVNVSIPSATFTITTSNENVFKYFYTGINDNFHNGKGNKLIINYDPSMGNRGMPLFVYLTPGNYIIQWTDKYNTKEKKLVVYPFSYPSFFGNLSLSEVNINHININPIYGYYQIDNQFSYEFSIHIKVVNKTTGNIVQSYNYNSSTNVALDTSTTPINSEYINNNYNIIINISLNLSNIGINEWYHQSNATSLGTLQFLSEFGLSHTLIFMIFNKAEIDKNGNTFWGEIKYK